MLTGVLDAFDLTMIAQCSRETRAAVASFWEGVRTQNPATRLCSVERRVDDAALNKTGLKACVPLSQAGDCVMCGVLTRFRHPVKGSMLCAPCGIKGEIAEPDSPFFVYSLIDETNVKNFFRLSPAVDLGKHLPFALRRAWVKDPKDAKRVAAPKHVFYVMYAPGYQSHVEGNIERVARLSGHFPPNIPLGRVFSLRDVICLLLEKYGGSQLLSERLDNHALPGLNPAKPE